MFHQVCCNIVFPIGDGEKIPGNIFITYREKNVTTNLMKHKGKKYLVVTFSSPNGKKYVTRNLMKHKGKKYLVVTFSLPIGKKMLQQT